MAGAKWNELLRLLRQLDTRKHGTGTTDAQLLDRFVHERDESAFELLLFRHGGMVLNVCRRILKRDQDAEDAFQATFLTLVRKARSIRRSEALAGWLYRVAHRAALEARARSARIARHEMPASLIIEPAADVDTGWNELRPILDEEMGRMPERFRLPLILCYLEGKTNEQAAHELGCPAGTVFSRLAKGRELLRTRLVRRGLTLSAGGLTALLAEHAAFAGPAPALLTAALQAGRLIAAGKVGAVSSQVHAITEGVLKAMFLQKLKNATVALVVLALLAAGGSGLVYQALTAAPTEQVQVEPPSAAPQAKGKAENKEPNKGGPEKPRQLVTPKKGGAERIVGQPGTLMAFEFVDFMPQVSGTLKKLYVDIGDRVVRGQLLAEIDAPDLQKDLEQAKISLALAKGKIVQQEAMVEIAVAEHRSAQTIITQREAELAVAKADLTRVQLQLKRVAAMVDNRSVERGMLDESTILVQSSKGRVDAANVAVETAKAESEIKRSRVRLAEAALQIEKLNLDSAHVGLERAEIFVAYTRISAPFDGIVTTRNVNTGTVVSNKTAAPIIRIIRADLMRLVLQISQQDAVHIRVGMPVSITVGQGGKAITTKVARVSSSLDPKTASMRVEADVPNLDGHLVDGMFTNTEIKVGVLRPDAMMIPHSCLITENTPFSVFVVKDGKAVRTYIDGDPLLDGVEVRRGLRADDQIVLDPRGLKDGDAVPTK
jgi:RND family efflux transporter MFP subunit